jgi:hypothetical protein
VRHSLHHIQCVEGNILLEIKRPKLEAESAYLTPKLSMYGAIPVVRLHLHRMNRDRFTLSSIRSKMATERLRWSRVCVLVFSTQVRGFKPGRSRRISQGDKIPSTASFGGEVKPAVPCRRFAACKRNLNVTWKLAFRQNSLLLFHAH